MPLKISIKTTLPGPHSAKILNELKQRNGGFGITHEYVHSGEGQGSYFEDIDGNAFLDFASQVASNPLGYNHPKLLNVLKEYQNVSPIKYGGQDFTIIEHLEMIQKLTSITPKKLDTAFLCNSGAEANENSIKIAMRKRKETKFGISFTNGWHGRTIGALSLTNSKSLHTKHYLKIPVKRLPFNENAEEELERIIQSEADPNEIGFIIMECIQGEGGYHIAKKEMVQDIRKKCKKYGIPLIMDEVQSGIGRTGKWWAFQHYGIEPDIMSSAKALQVGACISSKKMFPESGAISSTWGGGHILDLAMGMTIIDEIKKKKLLKNAEKKGKEIQKRLFELKEKTKIENVRGIGLMQAFDLENAQEKKEFIHECFKKGLIVLGCGINTIRIIPALNVNEKELNEGMNIIEETAKKRSR